MPTNKGLFLVLLTVLLISPFREAVMPPEMFAYGALSFVSATVGACAVAYYARNRRSAI